MQGTASPSCNASTAAGASLGGHTFPYIDQLSCSLPLFLAHPCLWALTTRSFCTVQPMTLACQRLLLHVSTCLHKQLSLLHPASTLHLRQKRCLKERRRVTFLHSSNAVSPNPPSPSPCRRAPLPTVQGRTASLASAPCTCTCIIPASNREARQVQRCNPMQLSHFVCLNYQH